MNRERTQWEPLLAAAAVTSAGVLPVFLTGALAVQLGEDLAIDPADLGLAVAAFFATAAATSTAGGRLAERIGPVSAMRVAAGLAAASMTVVAITARSLVSLIAGLVLGGLANAVAQPASNLLLARRVPANRLGMAFGVKQSAIPMATLIGGLAVPGLALTIGWRWAYAAGAFLAVLVGLLPSTGGDAMVARRGGRRGADDASLAPLVLLGTGAGLGAAAAGALGAFYVSSVVDAGVGEGTAGLLAAAASVIGIVTRFTSGARADRRGGGHLVVVATMLGLGAGTYLLLATGWAPFVVIGGLAGYAMGWGWPGLFQFAIVRNNPGAPGAATGITQSGTYLGGVLGPLLFGVIADTASYGAAWLMSAGLAVSASVAILAGRRMLLADKSRRGAPLP